MSRLKSHPNLNVFCCQCSNYSDGTFNCAAALAHIVALSPDVTRMQVQGADPNLWHSTISATADQFNTGRPGP